MDNTEICRMSVVDMEEAIRAKKLSPVEIMDAVLHRIENLNPSVNAYCTVVADSARKQAVRAESAVTRGISLGPLHGIPVSIKDLIFTKSIRTTGGSRIYEKFIPQHSDIVVERLEAAGAIIVGKTNTSEFGWISITDNPLFGATHNPWNLELTPGGSSGGAAASIALGMAPLAIGSDGGGSIRIPSSFCGVFGFKPSFGRVPQGSGFPGWETLSHIGPITRTVQDAALALEVIAGRDDRDRFSLPDSGLHYLQSLNGDLKGLKIAWSCDLEHAIVDPQVLKVTEAAAKAFTALGAIVEPISLGSKSIERAYSMYIGVRLAAVLQNKMEEWGDRIDPGLLRFIEKSEGKSATEYARASFELLSYWSIIHPFFQHYDLLLTPTVAVPPFRIGNYGQREIAGEKVSPLGWMPFTYQFNVTGQPAASIPCGWTENALPVGLQIVGRRFDDATVLQAASAFENICPWIDHEPLLLK